MVPVVFTTTGSGAHPASYPLGRRALTVGVERLGREADHLPASSAKVKNAWSYAYSPLIHIDYVVLIKPKTHLHGMVLS
jgi:hypothetical protein